MNVLEWKTKNKFDVIKVKILCSSKQYYWTFPGGSVVKNPPANAEDIGLIPWSGKIPSAKEQQGPQATTTEVMLQSLAAATIEPTCHTNEACMP